jgi:hypothetical protein
MKIAIIVFVTLLIAVIVVFAFRNWQVRRAQAALAAYLETLPLVAKDLTRPEGAILCLEDAYVRHDIEAAVACKVFVTESRLMIKKLLDEHNKPYPDDPAIIEEAAKTLELSFRKRTAESWPNFEGVQSFFIKREPYADKVVIVTEVCRSPDGGLSQQRIFVTETPKGWRVLNLFSE